MPARLSALLFAVAVALTRSASAQPACMRLTCTPLLLRLAVPACPSPAPAPSPTASISPLRCYSQALRRAKETGRNVLLLFSNPHCGPCHAMEQVLFGNPAGAELVASSYVPVVLVINLGGTVETQETIEARTTATRFGVLHPPALFVASRSGAKIGRIVGITRGELFGGLRQYAPPVP